MKIAFLNAYQNSTDRGAETFVKELSKRLSQKHAVDIIGGDLKPKKRWPILWRPFLDSSGLLVLLFTIQKVPHLLKNRYDIVIPLNSGWQSAIVRIITFLYGGKMVVSGQSGIGWDDRNNLWCFPNAFVALSQSAQQWAANVMPMVKSVYIPNGVDSTKFTQSGKERSLDLKKPTVLSVGALEKGKRLDLVIEAVAKLKDVSLLIVGKGPMQNDLEQKGKQLLGDRFLLQSFSFEEMPEVYRSCDIFTLPSKSQYSFEIVLVEAMASGLGVIANDDPIRKEIVGDAGILVDPTDTESYANAIKKALQIDWGKKPRQQAENFSWDEIAKKYEALFDSII